MPKIAKELTALEVRRLEAPGFVSVGGVPGLGLQITPTGAKSWILRVKIGTKRRDMGLGAFPGVSLAQAREKARAARMQIEEGQDPILARQRAQSALKALQARAMTFREATAAFLEAKGSEWRNAKHAAQWATSLETYAFPTIGQVHVSDIEQSHVLAVLQPIWRTKTETASRLRGRIENVLDWARVRGYRDGENPARWRGHLDKLLPRPSKIAKVEHHPAVPLDEVANFFSTLQTRAGMAAKALQFLALTATRSGEVRGATWMEIDLEQRVWTIPAERMKAGKEHRVPLSAPAIELLRSLPRLEGSDVVFFSPRGGRLSDMTVSAVMRRMGLPYVPHGLRSTFRDWAAERTTFPRDLAEKALAHTLESAVEAAYQRSDMLNRRREMMKSWADFLGGNQGHNYL